MCRFIEIETFHGDSSISVTFQSNPGRFPSETCLISCQLPHQVPPQPACQTASQSETTGFPGSVAQSSLPGRQGPNYHFPQLFPRGSSSFKKNLKCFGFLPNQNETKFEILKCSKSYFFSSICYPAPYVQCVFLPLILLKQKYNIYGNKIITLLFI